MKGALCIALALPALLRAADAPVTPANIWSAWSFEPGVLCCLGLAAILYLRGARVSRGASRKHMLCFWGGMGMLFVALISPVDALGEALFSGHMLQHEILILAAAPLFVLAHPLPAILWGLPFPVRRAAGKAAKTRVVGGLWRAFTRPVDAWCFHAAALWVWHAPVLFMATLSSDWIHTAQHLSFFVSALCFWWALIQSRRRAEYGHAVFYVFTTALHTGILGALLTFSPRVIYTIYTPSTPAWGLTPLQDQQIGGLIMWIPAGALYTAAGLALFWAWLRQSSATSLNQLAGSRYAS